MKLHTVCAIVALIASADAAHAADIPAVGDKVVSSDDTLSCKTSEDLTRIHELAARQNDVAAAMRYQHEHGCRFLEKGTHGVLEKMGAGLSRPGKGPAALGCVRPRGQPNCVWAIFSSFTKEPQP